MESIRTVVVDHNQNDEEDDQGHMTDKPLKNGRKYVDSGFVHDLMDAKTNQFYFMRAHVWPSMKSDPPHNVLIVLSVASGAVMHASCSGAVMHACSHVRFLNLDVVVMFCSPFYLFRPCREQWAYYFNTSYQ